MTNEPYLELAIIYFVLAFLSLLISGPWSASPRLRARYGVWSARRLKKPHSLI